MCHKSGPMDMDEMAYSADEQHDSEGEWTGQRKGE